MQLTFDIADELDLTELGKTPTNSANSFLERLARLSKLLNSFLSIL